MSLIFSKLYSFTNLLNLSFFLFGIFPILPEKLKGLPVVLLTVLSIVSFFFVNKENQQKINYKVLIGLTSLFTILFFSAFYTLSFNLPINKIETTLSLLFVPLAFMLIGSNRIKRLDSKKFFITFIISTLLLTIYSLFRYYESNLFLVGDLKVNSFRNLVTQMPFINDHPIYISIFLGLSVILTVPLVLNKDITIKTKAFLLISCFLNCSHLLLLSSKGIIVALLLSLIVLFSFQIKLLKIKVIIIVSLITFFIFSIFFISTTERRFREFFKETTYTELRINNSSSIRVAIFKCVLTVIKENPIIGYGWGLGSKKLNECYKEKSEFLYNKKYNSHNQYLGYYIDGGLLSIGVLLLFFFNQFKRAISSKNHSHFSILVFFSIIMLFENILERQSGIIIFIFIICFFTFKKVMGNKTMVIN